MKKKTCNDLVFDGAKKTTKRFFTELQKKKRERVGEYNNNSQRQIVQIRETHKHTSTRISMSRKNNRQG